MKSLLSFTSSLLSESSITSLDMLKIHTKHQQIEARKNFIK